MYIKYNLFLILIFLVSCQSLKSIQSSKGNAFKVKKLWIRQTFVKDFSRPLVVQNIKPVITSQGLVIQGNKINGIKAYTSKQGKTKWFFKVKGGLAGGVLVSKNIVFFGGADGFIYALYLKTGRLFWKKHIGLTLISTPVIKKNKLYFSSTYKIYCLNKNNGYFLWTYSTQLQTSEFINDNVASPTIGKSVIYMGSDSYFMALDFKGRLKWKQKISYINTGLSAVTAASVIGKVCVYFSHAKAGVYCLNKKTGNIIWKTNNGSHEKVLLVGSDLFYSSSNGYIFSLDQKSGKQNWMHKVFKSIATAPIIYNSVLIYGEYLGALRFISKKTGNSLGDFAFGRGMSATPVIHPPKEELYFMSNYGWLYNIKLISKPAYINN